MGRGALRTYQQKTLTFKSIDIHILINIFGKEEPSLMIYLNLKYGYSKLASFLANLKNAFINEVIYLLII